MIINKKDEEKLNYIQTPIEIYENLSYSKYLSEHYSNKFLEDMSMHLSISLSLKNQNDCFFYVDTANLKLRSMLEYRTHSFLRYDFDKLLSNNLISLITCGEGYALVNLGFDSKHVLKAIDFQNINYLYSFSLCNYVYFITRKYSGKYKLVKIAKDNLIEFSLTEVGISKHFFVNVLDKLYDASKDDPINNFRGRDIDLKFIELQKKHDIELLKSVGKSHWNIMNLSSRHFSEVYLSYSAYKLYSFRKIMLGYLLKKYNEKLQKIGNAYDFQGMIEHNAIIEITDEDLKKLLTGKMTCEQFCNKLYGKD